MKAMMEPGGASHSQATDGCAWAVLPALAQHRILSFLPIHTKPNARLVCREMRDLVDMHISQMMLLSSELDQQGMQHGAAHPAARVINAHGQSGALADAVDVVVGMGPPPPTDMPSGPGDAQAGTAPGAAQGQGQAPAAVQAASLVNARAVKAWARRMTRLTICGSMPAAAHGFQALFLMGGGHHPLSPRATSLLRVLPHLCQLTLHDCTPSATTLQALATAAPPSLTRLDLRAAGLGAWPLSTPLTWSALTGLPSLTHLTLSNWYFDGKSGDFLTTLPNLRALDISNCSNVGEGLGSVSTLTALTSWTYNNVQYAHAIHHEFVGISALTGLHKLEAMESDFFPDEVAVWSVLSSSLTSLSLSSQFQLTLDAVAVTAPRITALVELQVPDVLLTASLLAGLRSGTPHLAHLRVAWVNVSMADVVHYGGPVGYDLEEEEREWQRVKLTALIDEYATAVLDDALPGRPVRTELDDSRQQHLLKGIVDAVAKVLAGPVARDVALDLASAADAQRSAAAVVGSGLAPATGTSRGAPASTAAAGQHASCTTLEEMALTALASMRTQLSSVVRTMAADILVRKGARWGVHMRSPPQPLLDICVSSAVGEAAAEYTPRMQELLQRAQERVACHRRAQAQLALPLLTHLCLDHAYSGQHTCKLPLAHLVPNLVALEVGDVTPPDAVNWDWRQLFGALPEPGIDAKQHKPSMRAVRDATLALKMVNWTFLPHILPAVTSLTILCETEHDGFMPANTTLHWLGCMRRLVLDLGCALLESLPQAALAQLEELVLVDCWVIERSSLAQITHVAPRLRTLRLLWCSPLDNGLRMWPGLAGGQVYMEEGEEEEEEEASSGQSVDDDDGLASSGPEGEYMMGEGFSEEMESMAMDVEVGDGSSTSSAGTFSEDDGAVSGAVDVGTSGDAGRTVLLGTTPAAPSHPAPATAGTAGGAGAGAAPSEGSGACVSGRGASLAAAAGAVSGSSSGMGQVAVASARPSGLGEIEPAGEEGGAREEDQLTTNVPGLHWLLQLVTVQMPELRLLHVVGSPGFVPTLGDAAWLQRTVDAARLSATRGATAAAGCWPSAAGAAPFDVEWFRGKAEVDGGGGRGVHGGEVRKQQVRAHLAGAQVTLPDMLHWSVGLGF